MTVDIVIFSFYLLDFVFFSDKGYVCECVYVYVHVYVYCVCVCVCL